jgi:hypothetical protein
MARLKIVGFPRCGTTYLYVCCRDSFGINNVDYTQHRIQPLRDGDSVVTIIRDPLECISSWMKMSAEIPSTTEGLIDWYCRFLQASIENTETSVCLSFDSLVNSPQICMDNISNKFGLDKISQLDINDINLDMKTNHPGNFPRPTDKDIYYEKIKSSNLFDKVQDLYAKTLCIAI